MQLKDHEGECAAEGDGGRKEHACLTSIADWRKDEAVAMRYSHSNKLQPPERAHMSLHRSPRHATHPESASGVRAGDFSELLCDRYREYFSSAVVR
jgi:hypothetical protein